MHEANIGMLIAREVLRVIDLIGLFLCMHEAKYAASDVNICV
jgi:hypothetical protein